MTVQELIELLEEFEGDTQVRIAYQPSYPLRALVSNVTSAADDEDDPDSKEIVWIATSDYVPSQENPYAPRAAWS